MSINDTLAGAADDLAQYLYDPNEADYLQYRNAKRELAVLAICRGLLTTTWVTEQIDAAIDGDAAPLEEHILYLQKHFPDRMGPLEQERREWQSLVNILKAVDEHIVPLLPDLDWAMAEDRAAAQKWREEFDRELGKAGAR